MTSAKLPGLKFKKSIVSSAKDSIPLKELLERLDALSTELSRVEQDHFNVKSLNKIKDELVNKKLLNHKDTGVQALVACCLSDILRLYAPDAPYTDAELTETFKLFVRQFKKLADPENGYYAQQVYLVTRLAEVRSIILVTDIENGASLIESIFSVFYDSTNLFHKKLEPIISDILIEIISEWDQISMPVLKLILNKFLTHHDSNSVTSSLTTSSASAFNFSVNICNANPDRIARQLTKFFSEVLYENTPEEVDFKALKKLHGLLVEIWRQVPEILASVMGLLGDELSADSDQFRALATETVGEILSAQTRVNFVTVHKDTWHTWINKTLDISPHVRAKWVEHAAEVLVGRSDVLVDITQGLSKTLIDTDERVRLATVTAIANIPSDVLLRKVHDASILTGLVQLAREKHAEIRESAICILGSLFKDSYDDVFGEEDDDELTENYKVVKQIPNHLLNLYYINETDINALVDVTLMEDVLPDQEDDLERVERLLKVVSTLDEKAMASFIAFNKRQQQLSKVLAMYISFCEEMNGTTTNDDLKAKFEKAVSWLSFTLPERHAPRESLHKFATINNRRLYSLVKWCISSDSDYARIITARKELFQRLQDNKTINSSAAADLIATFKLLIYRSSLTLFNRSNIAPLLRLSDEEKYSKTAQNMIENISAISPMAFQNQIENLITTVKDDKKEGSKHNTLKALYHIFKKLTDYIPNDDKHFLDTLTELAQNGTPKEAEYAIKVLSLTDKLDMFGTLIMESIYPIDVKSKTLATHLAAISELFLVAPDIPGEHAEDMTPVLVKDILLTNKTKAHKNDPEWIGEDQLEAKHIEVSAKLYAMRIFTNRLQSLTKDQSVSEESVTTTAENVLKLLLSLIAKGGEIVNSKAKNYPTPRHFQALLRLEAGLCLLKLAQFPKFNALMKPVVIERIILLVQDENEYIRSTFIRTLTDLLKKEEISHKFLPAVYFFAYEPNAGLKSEIKTWIRSTFAKRSETKSGQGNDIVFEKSITGLIHCIAHHAEFMEYTQSVEGDERQDNLLKAYTYALEYTAFFLENVALEKNISLIYYFATRVKQYRDATLPESAYTEDEEVIENIYRVSDLVQLAIRDFADVRGWSITTYPGKLQLSAELYSKMLSSEEGQKVVSTSYIPDDILKRLTQIVRQKINSISNAKRPRSADVVAQKKKFKVEKPKHKKRATTRSSDSDSDDEFNDKAAPVATRKSSRAKRISYTDQVKEYEEGEGENDEDDDDLEL